MSTITSLNHSQFDNRILDDEVVFADVGLQSDLRLETFIEF
jgi:hypothetical protein